MKNLTKLTCGIAAALVFTITQVTAATIAQWTFEAATPSGTSATFGPISPETGAGSATGVHAATATVWSSPSGNGSPKSFSATQWQVGDYWQFQVSTLTLDSIQLGFDQQGSNTGPRDFQLRYSTDGSTFTDFGSVYSIINDSWVTATFKSTSHFSVDLSGVSAINNQAAVYFRLVDMSTINITGVGAVATTGTSRIDNFTVDGLTIVPEPSTVALVGMGMLGVFVLRRRRS